MAEGANITVLVVNKMATIKKEIKYPVVHGNVQEMRNTSLALELKLV